MISNFYKKFSLNNLQNDKPNGQVATILILIIVVILILILTTVNLGQLSISSTNLSNVADSAALVLASSLAARANYIAGSLQDSCGDFRECCTKGWGWLAWIFIVIVVVVVAVASWGYGLAPAAAFFAAVGAGAAAGVAASAMAGTDILQGAIQGAMIGAAIGGGVSVISGMVVGAGAASAGTAAETAALAGGATAQEAAALAAQAIANYATSAAGLTAGMVGSVAGGTLAIASSGYNTYVADQNMAAAFASASKSLNGLLDRDRYREGVFLQIFSQTVDDPKLLTDIDDLNGNGDITDKVSRFLYYWDGRVKALLAIIPVLEPIVSAFFYTDLQNFKNYINGIITGTSSGCGSEGGCVNIPGILSRAEDEAGVDGSIASVARALNPAFWDDANDVSFKNIVDGFKAFTVIAEGYGSIGLSQLVSSWEIYLKNFYNDDVGQSEGDGTVTDYYHKLEKAKDALTEWKTQIKNKRNQLLLCELGNLSWNFGSGDEAECQACLGGSCLNNCMVEDGPLPCKLSTTINGGSLDYNINDEITPALNDIDTLIGEINAFQIKIVNYATSMQAAYASFKGAYGGLNPATYSWPDSRGEHSVTAEVGDFLLARTVTTESGNGWSNTTCVRLVDDSDDGTRSWVKIIRQDPSNQDIKSGKVSLGLWNPFFDGKITKKGTSKYTWNSVELRGN